FGLDEEGGLGVKRTGSASITQVDSLDFVIGAAPAMSCDGDSGGPVFITRNASEEVAGITAFGDARCMVSGTNMRVDAYEASFITPTLAASPSPRPALDPSADFCATSCAGDADCPLGMGCVPNPAGGMACGPRGLPPGQLGGACGSGGECPSGMCLTVGTSCSCYAPCETPMRHGDDGGCAVQRHHDAGDALPLLVMAWGLGRTGRRGRRQRLRSPLVHRGLHR
ncbi:MAG: peptidase S1, partial [Kofleriaceae bacterium]